MIQATEKRFNGYKLFLKNNEIYHFLSSEGLFIGTLSQVCQYSMFSLGFSLNEIEMAVLEMEKNFHDAAEFGMMKRFMYTYDLENNNNN